MKAAVFDLDGTLVDSAPDIHAAACAMLDDAGLPPISLAQARSFVGHGAPVFIERLAQALDLPPDPGLRQRLLDGFLARYETAVQLSRLYPGVRGLLAALAAGGWRLGLCTNKPIGPTRAVLAHFGLGGTFSSVIGGDSLAVRKPDPAPLRHVIAELKAAHPVFVGDSEVDAETARTAGVPFALFTRGYRTTPVAELVHAHAFDRFDTLAEALERLVRRP